MLFRNEVQNFFWSKKSNRLVSLFVRLRIFFMLDKLTGWSAKVNRDNFIVGFRLILGFIKTLFDDLIFEARPSPQTFNIFLQIYELFCIYFSLMGSRDFSH